MNMDQGLMLLAGVAGIWFAMRFLYRPKTASGGFMRMFKREAISVVPGIGLEALRSMVDDLETLVKNTESLRGLIIAGPFAVRKADATSPVTAILLSTDLAGQDGPLALAGWPYPARGHEIRDRKIEMGEGYALHRLTLRGAPPVELAFVLIGANLPAVLAKALSDGAFARDIGTNEAELQLARWDIRPIKTTRNPMGRDK
ncbi:MAG: hypothetical protein ACRDBL_11655 [Rhabdaerophilum sp.]